MTSIVLAGGRGSRLGREKHSEVIAGQGLIERTIGRLGLLSDEILLVISNRQSKSSFPSYGQARIAVDLYPGKGALGGIYTGLVHSASFHSLVVACDMPFLNLGLLRHMIGLAPGFDVVIPRIGHFEEPLHAVYSKNCVAPMESLLKQGSLRITGFFHSVKVRYVGSDEIDRFDPAHLSFFNINTKADLEKAQRLAARESAAG